MTDDCRSVPIPAWVRCADAAVLVLLSLAFIVFVTGGVRGKVAGIPISVTSGARFVLYALLVGGVRHLAFRGRTLLDRVASVGVLQAANTPALVRDEATAGRAVEGRAGKTEVVFVVALMAVLAVVMTYPQVRRINSVPDPGDPLFSVWRLAWIAHQLAHDPLHLFDANIFYPERHTFALSDSILLPGLVGAPFLWLGVPAVRFYNLYLIATFAFAGIAMYLFVRSLTGKWPPALVAAIVFAFYPFRFEHYSHFELQFSFWMPLALWSLQRTFERGRLRDGLLTGGAVAGQTLSCLYFGIYLVAYLIPISVVFGFGWQRFRAIIKPLLAGACLAAVLLAPMVVPYLQVRRMFGERSSAEVAYYSAEPQHYLVPHLARSPYRNLLGGPHEIERELFPGILVVVLALVAMWPPLSVVRIAYIVALLFAFDASLGQHGAVHPFLYSWLLPFRGLRVPARFSMLVGFSLAVLAGFGVARLGSRLQRPATYLLAGVLSATVLVESRPTLALQPVPAVPAIYQWFNGRTGTVVAALPPGSVEEPWRRECAYTYFSTFDWPVMVNGNSGFLPPSYWRFNAAMLGFPDDRSLRLLRERGVEYVVLHEQFYGRDAYARVVDAVDGRPDVSTVAAAWSGGYEARICRLNPR